MLYVGIDVAKNKHDYCIIDSDGVVHLNGITITNTKEGFDSLYSSILSMLPDKDLNNVRIGSKQQVITALTFLLTCIRRACRSLL